MYEAALKDSQPHQEEKPCVRQFNVLVQAFLKV